MDRQKPSSGAAGPIMLGGRCPSGRDACFLKPRHWPRHWVPPLLSAYVETSSYLVEGEPKEDVRGNSLQPKDIDEGMTAEARDFLRILDVVMAETTIVWSSRVPAADPGTALARLGSEVHVRMIVVGTRHQGVGDKNLTAAQRIDCPPRPAEGCRSRASGQALNARIWRQTDERYLPWKSCGPDTCLDPPRKPTPTRGFRYC